MFQETPTTRYPADDIDRRIGRPSVRQAEPATNGGLPDAISQQVQELWSQETRRCLDEGRIPLPVSAHLFMIHSAPGPNTPPGRMSERERQQGTMFHTRMIPRAPAALEELEFHPTDELELSYAKVRGQYHLISVQVDGVGDNNDQTKLGSKLLTLPPTPDGWALHHAAAKSGSRIRHWIMKDGTNMWKSIQHADANWEREYDQNAGTAQRLRQEVMSIVASDDAIVAIHHCRPEIPE